MEQNRVCPQCRLSYPESAFECLPRDARCNRCVPVDTALQIYDQKVQEAGKTITKALDAAQGAKSLKPVERLLSEIYDKWGGPGAFADDVVNWIKDLAGMPGGRGKSAAVSAAIKLAQIHARVDKMKIEDDWKAMDTETLRENIKLKMLALFTEASADDAKRNALNSLLKGHKIA